MWQKFRPVIGLQVLATIIIASFAAWFAGVDGAISAGLGGLVSIIAGLVTEIGSPLSHGAVVAREYGIPAVVCAKGAKKFLCTGDLVRLDGNRGIIEKISQ